MGLNQWMRRGLGKCAQGPARCSRMISAQMIYADGSRSVASCCRPSLRRARIFTARPTRPHAEMGGMSKLPIRAEAEIEVLLFGPKHSPNERPKGMKPPHEPCHKNTPGEIGEEQFPPTSSGVRIDGTGNASTSGNEREDYLRFLSKAANAQRARREAKPIHVAGSGTGAPPRLSPFLSSSLSPSSFPRRSPRLSSSSSPSRNPPPMASRKLDL